MRALERLFSSRPARIAIILLWLILGAPGGSFAQRLQDVQKNEGSSFLPGSSESVRELTLAKRFPSGERFAAITVIRRDGGLKPRDLAAIERTRASLAANVEANAAVERCRSRDIGSHVHALAADAWASTKAGLAAGDPRAPVFAKPRADRHLAALVRRALVHRDGRQHSWRVRRFGAYLRILASSRHLDRIVLTPDRRLVDRSVAARDALSRPPNPVRRDDRCVGPSARSAGSHGVRS
jgi:hypothetical protein